MTAGKFYLLLKKIFNRSEKAGVKLRFRNDSPEDILSLRVIISNEVHEFKNLPAGTSTTPFFVAETQLYFHSYVITQSGKFYFEPRTAQLKKTVKKGEIVISIFIEKNDGQQSRVVMHPEVSTSG